MLGLPQVRRYFLYRDATDMRKSFNGLGGLVINEMGGKLLSGDGFVFVNKRRTMLKILVWDRTGFVIYYKRLSSGTFEVPVGSSATSMEVSVAKIMLILEGVSLDSVKWRKRYQRA
ncbi:MAG: IS66 family insertion sequence element accessory protein TnpB [Saprospiraceae bacterium]|nr:IS66 family insertion sequence element accessory protein TnpB [Saprospiraceae bacterium]